MKRRSWIGFGAIAFISVSGALYIFWPYLFPRTPWLYEPEIIGNIDIKAETAEGKWVVRPGSRISIELVFHTRKGTAKGISIILELGELGLLNACSGWSVIEGRYLWRYTSIREGRINLTVEIPIDQGVEHKVRLWYAYTNEDPVSIDSQTILTTLQAPEYIPPEESTGRVLRPFPVVFVFAVVMFLFFLYSRRRKTRKKTTDYYRGHNGGPKGQRK